MRPVSIWSLDRGGQGGTLGSVSPLPGEGRWERGWEGTGRFCRFCWPPVTGSAAVGAFLPSLQQVGAGR